MTGPAEGGELTVEELAGRVGMSVRNVREWQGQGLLEPPTRRGRNAYYNPGHVERIRQIRALREDGFPLDLIARILGEAGGGEDEARAFGRALQGRLQDEEPEVIGLAEFASRFGVSDLGEMRSALSERWFERSATLGLVRAREDGRFEILSPRLARLAEFLIGLGISMDEILTLGEQVYERQQDVAAVFVEVFRRHLLEPFEQGKGSREGGWANVGRTLEELRPFALDAVDVLFRLAMDETSERAVQAEIDRRLDLGGR